MDWAPFLSVSVITTIQYSGVGQVDIGERRPPPLPGGTPIHAVASAARTRNGTSLPVRRTMRPRWLWCLLTHMSALRELLATETTSHDASKPICHFCRSLEACWGLRIAQN